MGAEFALSLRGVRFRHPGQRDALQIDRIDIAGGTRAAVVGPSGCGKTTLLNLIGGILSPETGSIEIGGVPLESLDDARRRRFRLEAIGFVFQEFELLEHLDVRENILLPLSLRSVSPDAAVEMRLLELADRCGIADKLARGPRRLSHGERQRVAICRALLPGPKLLLADEPTGSLDPKTGGEVLEMMFSEAKRAGATVLVVTHDRSLLKHFEVVIGLGENDGEAAA
ncbi:MAG TPA: ABC transporter ATP-binding protein [Planctomycetes bacterium]|nr:ABC transporter ATP-binding protein [Planctomycetota bacterium]HIN80868.1 ABC transporter ATP-binding protein [Planctomycetota bacterium]